jgi:hypothetical protein
LERFAKAIGVNPTTLKNHRSIFRKYPEKDPAGSFSNSWDVVRTFASQPDRSVLLRVKKWTGAEALDFVRDRRNVARLMPDASIARHYAMQLVRDLDALQGEHHSIGRAVASLAENEELTARDRASIAKALKQLIAWAERALLSFGDAGAPDRTANIIDFPGKSDAQEVKDT